MPDPEHHSPLLPGDDWPATQAAVRARISAAFGPAPDPPPPAAEVLEVVETREYIRERVRFRGESGEWIPAWLLRPPHASGPVPVAICPHPTTAGAGKDEVVGLSGPVPGSPPLASRSYGLELVEWGIATLCPDILGDGERIPPGAAPYGAIDFYHRHPDWSLLGKLAWDTSRGIDYLATRPEFDAGRIGIIGHSLGGHVGAFGAALDERIKVLVNNGGTVCWDEGDATHWPGNPGAGWRYLPQSAAWLLESTAPPPFSFVELHALIAPRPQLVMLTENGARRQRLAEFAPLVRQTYQALGAGEQFEVGMYSGGHGFPPEARWRAYRWLQRWL